MNRLWTSQASTIREMARTRGIQLGFVGIDADDNPVVWVRDSLRTFTMAVHRDGTGRDAASPIRWLTDEEIVGLPGIDSALLFSLPLKPPTQEVWHVARRSVSVNR